jgi:N6-L-threonylcarbamoyladenine synthase
MIILGIETSCDETAISVVEAEGSIESPSFKLLGSALVSQMKLHEKYGGVVPNLAKREHVKNLPIVLDKALKEARIEISKINAIAVTVGPGLEPALWTGINFAQDLSKKWGIPIIPTNHMEGHIASVLLGRTEAMKYPALALLISGGHTELVYLKSWIEKEIIGETKDDAVGEAFDKVGRMIGLPYPGGPEISKLAEKARTLGVSLETEFPRPMIHSGDFNFSFSGLKTAVFYYLKSIRNSLNSFSAQVVKDHAYSPAGELLFSARQPAKGSSKLAPSTSFINTDINERIKMAIAREFEDAVMEVLVEKSRKAIFKYKPKTFIIGGGVIANNHLRESFKKMVSDMRELLLQIPEKKLTTDNAVMIAMAGYLSYISGMDKKLETRAKGNLKYA